MNTTTVLLYPLSIIYGVVMAIRNRLYDRGYKRSHRFGIPVIAIGNLSVGGTGKTPTVEYLTRMLKSRYEVAILSRGYNRTTKGLLFAEPEADAMSLGDESYQLYRKYGHCAHIVVGEDRVTAIQAITKRFPNTTTVVLDDAYQHRSVVARLNILLTDFSRPFYGDYILPAGRLRESRTGAVRADGIIVTKCPENMTSEEKKMIKNCIIRYAGKKNVFFSRIKYGTPQSFWGKEAIDEHQKVVLLSGIANPNPFEAYAKKHFFVLTHFVYPDHYSYKPAHLEGISRYIENSDGKVALLTTEKDMVKLLNPIFEAILSRLTCYYVPIEMTFEENEIRFDEWVLQHIETCKEPAL